MEYIIYTFYTFIEISKNMFLRKLIYKVFNILKNKFNGIYNLYFLYFY